MPIALWYQPVLTNNGAKKKGQESRLVRRIDKLMQQLEEERQEHMKETER